MSNLNFLWPIVRGLILSLIGLGIGIGIGSVISAATDNPAIEINLSIGYLLALIGWLLGIGVWKYPCKQQAGNVILDLILIIKL